jgi:hypothetical protein
MSKEFNAKAASAAFASAAHAYRVADDAQAAADAVKDDPAAFAFAAAAVAAADNYFVAAYDMYLKKQAATK